MGYKPDLILLVNFGNYNEERTNPPSVDQIPLIDFHGFPYLRYLQKKVNISEYDKEQIGLVSKAYNEFPVKIKCAGKHRRCENVATHIILPWEKRHKVDAQSGPDQRMQTDVLNMPFYCPECAEEFLNDYNGIIKLPISFRALEMREKDLFPGWDPKRDMHLDINRTELHYQLKRVAYEILHQGLEIDTRGMRQIRRMIINYKQAKEIVNKLLGIPEQPLLPGMENAEIYEIRPLYRKKRGPKGRTGEGALNL
ncbi:MAG: hypothetical protein J7K72_02375 [Candidatus Aenigmarchaeota archaeon]|nr:hypothetical protein [Candidatus Aenigmarchaeota archaeon]